MKMNEIWTDIRIWFCSVVRRIVLVSDAEDNDLGFRENQRYANISA